MGTLETWLAHAGFVWHCFLNFSAGVDKLGCDRKAPSNQHQTTSSGHRGGNKGKIRQVERRRGLTQLLVESFSEIIRNRMRSSICVRRSLGS